MQQVEEPPFTPGEKAEMLARAARGELTPEDTARFIRATRASFLASAAKAPAKRKPVEKDTSGIDPNADLDFL